MAKLEGTKVLVFGATGTQGAPVVTRLLDRGARVHAVARTRDQASALVARGVDPVVVDLRDRTSLTKAFASVEAAFLVFSASVPDAEWLLHARNALEAVREAGIARVVVTTSTIVPSAPVGISRPDAKLELLDRIRATAPSATVLSPTFFLENFSTALRAAVLGGVIPQALPENVPVRYLSLDDQAAFVVAALERPELAGRHLPIAGAESLTGAALAERIGVALERPVAYHAIPPEAFRAQLLAFLDPAVVDALTGMLVFAGGEGAPLLDPDLAPTLAALPIPTESVVEWARRAFRGA